MSFSPGGHFRINIGLFPGLFLYFLRTFCLLMKFCTYIVELFIILWWLCCETKKLYGGIFMGALCWRIYIYIYIYIYIHMYVYIYIFLWRREGGEGGGDEGDGTYSVFFFIFYYFKGSIYFHEVLEITFLLLPWASHKK